MPKQTPIVINCEEVATEANSSSLIIAGTPAEVKMHFTKLVRGFKKSQGRDNHWGQDAKNRLIASAKANNVVLEGLPPSREEARA
tara:strand:+ start:571 stop:825 length:255 start_codon:yes stop_codon:yes gene_type:complete